MANRSPHVHVFIGSVKVKGTDINIDIGAGLSRLDTIDAEVFYSQGAQTVTLRVTEPLVLDGLNIDHPNLMIAGADVTVQMVIGPKSMVGPFVVLDGNVTDSGNGSGQSSLTLEGRLEPWNP